MKKTNKRLRRGVRALFQKDLWSTNHSSFAKWTLDILNGPWSYQYIPYGSNILMPNCYSPRAFLSAFHVSKNTNASCPNSNFPSQYTCQQEKMPVICFLKKLQHWKVFSSYKWDPMFFWKFCWLLQFFDTEPFDKSWWFFCFQMFANATHVPKWANKNTMELKDIFHFLVKRSMLACPERMKL